MFDLHNDLITSGQDKKAIIEIAENYSRNEMGVVLAFWSTEHSAIPDLSYLPERKNLYFAVEDMHFFDFSDADRLLKLRPVYCGLTWNFDNGLAGGALSCGRLTAKGKNVLRFLNSNAIAADTAHLNRQSFYDVIDTAETVINSHTFIYDINPHPRNITFGQIEAIVNRGGLVGFTPVRSFVGGGVDGYVSGIDKCLQRFGDENFAIGTDINGSTDFPDELTDYSGYKVVVEKLFRLGYSVRTLDKLMNLNAAEFCRRRQK